MHTHTGEATHTHTHTHTRLHTRLPTCLQDSQWGHPFCALVVLSQTETPLEQMDTDFHRRRISPKVQYRMTTWGGRVGEGYIAVVVMGVGVRWWYYIRAREVQWSILNIGEIACALTIFTKVFGIFKIFRYKYFSLKFKIANDSFMRNIKL